MKRLFFMRWLRRWRKRRIVNSAWQMRAMPPCVFCQRPIPERSAFCNHCGAAQTVERHTSGQHELAQLKANLAASQQVPPEPSISPPAGRAYDITAELRKAPRGQRPFETFQKLIHGEE